MHTPLSALAACFVISRNRDCNGIAANASGGPRTLSAGLSDIESVAVETPASNYDRLLEWLKENDAEVNDNLCFQPSSRGGGFGAFVTGDVSKDEVLVTIPRKICVSMDDVKNDPDSGEVFQKLMTQAGPGGNTVALAGIVAKQHLIAQAKGSDAIKFGPYFDTLPWKRGVNNQEHVLFWSDEDVESLLEGTMCYREATSLREEVDLAINVLNKIIGKSIRIARGELSDTDSSFSLPWEPKPEPLKDLVEGLPEAVRGAFVCLLTRSFQDGDDDGDEEKLVPWLDMLQVCNLMSFVLSRCRFCCCEI